MRRSTLLLAALLPVLLATPAAASTSHAPSPGAAGLEDRLSPLLGNGGYDTLHYDLDVRYATSAPTQPLDGTVTIVAKATQSLSQFNLDFAGTSVGDVEVNGRRAAWARDGQELVVTPRKPIRDRSRFVVRVEDFVATPTVVTDDLSTTALFVHEDGSATAGQPFYAHYVFPSNDHPRDKASYSFEMNVPAGTTAVANGVPVGRPKTRRGRTTFRYLQRQPMASELIQLAMGDLEFSVPGRRPGVLLRDVTATAITDEMLPNLAVGVPQYDWITERVGRYPFDAYGTLVIRADLGFALETQTLSIFDTSWFEAPQGVWDPTMMHELAHSWFGNSVSPYEWSDLWNNEGHASWYEFVWAEEQGFLAEDTVNWPDEQGYATLEELMRAVYAHGDQWRHDWGPVARPVDADAMFTFQSYHGGALVLYALRQKVGEATFDRIEREWVRRYRDASPSTADFIALASKVARRDLRGFLGEWLYGTTTPPMPGHPDWTVDPVEEPAPAARALQAPRPRD
jgi:aminopeptidase N